MSLVYTEKQKIVYECTVCGAAGCKLWREYNTFLDRQTLYCVRCACADQTSKENEYAEQRVDRNGDHADKYGHMSCTIGWLVPAVLTAEEDTFWGYSSIPEPLVRWWRDLRTQPDLAVGDFN